MDDEDNHLYRVTVIRSFVSIGMKLVAGVGSLGTRDSQPADINKRIVVSSFPDPISCAQVKVYPCDYFNVELSYQVSAFRKIE